MLQVSIIATVGLLILVCSLALLKKHAPALPISLLLFLALASPMYTCMVMFPLLYQAIILGLLQCLFLVPLRGRKLFVWSAPVGTVLAWILAFAWSYHRQPDFEALRERYPDESLDQRLPVRPAQEPLKENEFKMGLIEHELESESTNHIWRRQESLKKLHEAKVDQFVKQPGFGVGRVVRIEPTESNLKSRRDETPIPQHGSSEPTTYPKNEKLDFDDLHRSALLDFANPAGWGLVNEKDRRVIGFLPHGMTKVPSQKEWRATNVDLVGLVVHEQPTAYVSANLPRMDELRKAPTRPLDAFEAAGLVELRGGKHEFVQDVNGRVRMLGAIRSTKQCVQCHGGSRGDLLGAFSYTLEPSKPR